MRYLKYAAGIVAQTVAALLIVTGGILWIRSRPPGGTLLLVGCICAVAGFHLRRAAALKTCSRCRAKAKRQVTRCGTCGSEFPANSAEYLSEPFYK
jgi:hypothetical protein